MEKVRIFYRHCARFTNTTKADIIDISLYSVIQAVQCNDLVFKQTAISHSFCNMPELINITGHTLSGECGRLILSQGWERYLFRCVFRDLVSLCML